MITLEKGEKIAGFLFEPIQGEAGVSYNNYFGLFSVHLRPTYCIRE